MTTTHLEVILPPETPTTSRALVPSATPSLNPKHYSNQTHTEAYLSRLDEELISSRLLGMT